MRVFLRIRIVVFILFSIVILLLSSVISVFAQAPTITSFTPTTICQGSVVTIKGTKFTGATAVKLGTDAALSFKIADSNTITATVSYKAMSGVVTITTSGGTIASKDTLTIKPAPQPGLKDISAILIPFTNCNGNATYQLSVSNTSVPAGGSCNYDIDWGDNSAHFTQTDWSVGAEINHTYNAQGYYNIKLTVTPTNGCARSVDYKFYNGTNPLASITTTEPTAGLCAPAEVVFIIDGWKNNTSDTYYKLEFGDEKDTILTHPLNLADTNQYVHHLYLKSSCPGGSFTATLTPTNGCYPTPHTVGTIDIRARPIANFWVDTVNVCVSAPVCFTNLTTHGYSGYNCDITSTYLWDFGDGATSKLETPSCHSYANAGTYNITLIASNATCKGDTITKTIIIHPVSPAPVVSASPITYCQGQTAVPLKATGTGLLWYTTPTGGTGTATAPTPSTITPGTKTWYVSQTIVNNCESPRVSITVTVYATPAAPGAAPVNLCVGQTAAPLSAAGTGLLWYTTAIGGVGTATAPTPLTAIAGSTNYYVSQTINGCEGPRAVITVTVSSVPGLPGVVSPVSYCQGQMAIPLTASGSGLLWYTSALGGIGSPVAPTPSTVTAGSTNYYVSQVTSCGESVRALITVIINPGPFASIAYDKTVLCNVKNSVATLNPPLPVIQTGTAGGAYSIAPSTGLPVNASTGEIDPSGAVAGTYTVSYFIKGTGGCSDFTTKTTVTVTGTPNASISYPPVCSSDGPISVQLTGTQGGSFTSTTGLTINLATGSITPATSTPGTYTVTYTISASSPCPGFTTNTSVSITKAPLASIVYNTTNLCNVVNSVSTPNPPVSVTLTGDTGGNYSISPSTGLTINAANGTLNPSGATAGAYTISYTIQGKGGCANYTTSVNVSVSGSPNASISYPPICSSDALVNPQFAGTLGGTYTSTAGISINSITGGISPATSNPGTYKVTYTISPSAPCPGFTTTADVTITKAPQASIAYTTTNLCNVVNSISTPNPPVPVIQLGDTGGAYSISPSTGLPINAASGTLDPSGAIAGTYTISYTIQGKGGCLNYTTTAIVAINSTPNATITYPGAPYCQAINTPEAVSLTGTVGGTFTSSPGLSINPATGEINPSASTSGIYTVTYTIQPSAPCPGFTTTTKVEIDASPVLTFSTLTRSICSGGTAIFTPSSTVANTVYTWSVIGSLPTGVSGITSGTVSGAGAVIALSFTNTGIASQSLTIQVLPVNPSQNPCEGTRVNLSLNVNPIPPLLATDTATFCMHTPPQTLSINALPGNTVNWYDQNQAPLASAPVINTNAPTQFKYFVSQSNIYGCEGPKVALIAVINSVVKITSSSYTNPSVCGIPSGSIVLNVLDLNDNVLPNYHVTVHFTKFQTAYQIADSTDATGKITVPLVAGSYSNIYVETKGCNSQQIPDVFVLKDPDPPAQPIAGYNGPVCSENILSLSASSPTGSILWPIDYVWVGPAFGPYADTTRNTVVTFPSATLAYQGTYIVYAIQNNCISPATSFTVEIKQSPSKPKIITVNPLCIGDNLTLQALSSIPGNNTLNYMWNGPGTGFPVNTAYAAIKNVQVTDGGIYTIVVTAPQTGCSSSIDTLIKIGGYPIVKLLQDSLTLPTGYLLNLSSSITNADDPNILPIQSYEWMPSINLSCNDAICSAPVASIKNNICYSIEVTNVYGCSGRDTICIKVNCLESQVFVPNAFTPHGNIPGNSKLMVRASGIASVKSFRVFDRWGKLVFERNNFPPNDPAFGWDGLVNGKVPDTGVYIYTVEVICENGMPYFKKDNVTLFNN